MSSKCGGFEEGCSVSFNHFETSIVHYKYKFCYIQYFGSINIFEKMYFYQLMVLCLFICRVAAVVVITGNPGLVVVHLLPKSVIGLNIQVLQAKNTIIIVKLRYHNGISQENG